MRQKKCKMTLLVFALFISFFCLTGKDCWSSKYSSNVHWVFCIDTSGSMKKRGQMDLLKLVTDRITTEILDTKKNIVRTGDRITFFSFDEDARLEISALYQTENDLLPIKAKLIKLNDRRGNLTFISEAIIQALDFIDKYSEFFRTNALYVLTDGKSEPYSPKWPKDKIMARKNRDSGNFKRISLLGRDHGLNIWVGVLRWEAFEDARSFVKKMGKGGHLVDLTDFNRLSLEKALTNFTETVRTSIKLGDVRDIDFGTIPYNSEPPYRRHVLLDMAAEKTNGHPIILGRIDFDPDNPSEISQGYPVEIKTSEAKMLLNLRIDESDRLKPGTYKGKLNLYPSQLQFGTLVIEPSQFDVRFKKTGFLSFYLWKVSIAAGIALVLVFFLISKIKRKMPIKV